MLPVTDCRQTDICRLSSNVSSSSTGTRQLDPSTLFILPQSQEYGSEAMPRHVVWMLVRLSFSCACLNPRLAETAGWTNKQEWQDSRSPCCNADHASKQGHRASRAMIFHEQLVSNLPATSNLDIPFKDNHPHIRQLAPHLFIPMKTPTVSHRGPKEHVDTVDALTLGPNRSRYIRTSLYVGFGHELRY